MSIYICTYLFLQYYLSQISPQPTGNSSEPRVPLHNDSGVDSVIQPLASIKMTENGTEESETDVKDLFVVVDNPEKHTTTMESYITFRVTTKVG